MLGQVCVCVCVCVLCVVCCVLSSHLPLGGARVKRSGEGAPLLRLTASNHPGRRPPHLAQGTAVRTSTRGTRRRGCGASSAQPWQVSSTPTRRCWLGASQSRPPASCGGTAPTCPCTTLSSTSRSWRAAARCSSQTGRSATAATPSCGTEHQSRRAASRRGRGTPTPTASRGPLAGSCSTLASVAAGRWSCRLRSTSPRSTRRPS